MIAPRDRGQPRARDDRGRAGAPLPRARRRRRGACAGARVRGRGRATAPRRAAARSRAARRRCTCTTRPTCSPAPGYWRGCCAAASSSTTTTCSPSSCARSPPRARWRAIARAGERSTFAVANLVAEHERVDRRDRALARPRARRAGRRRAQRPAAAWIAQAQPARGGALEDPRLVYVGAISSQDGVAQLAECCACSRTSTACRARCSTIVGDGDARADVEQALRRAGSERGRVGRLDRRRADPRAPRAGGHLHRPGAAVAPEPPLDDDQDRRVPDGRAACSRLRPARDGAHARRRRDHRRARRRRCAGGRRRATGARRRRARGAVCGRPQRADALTWEHSERALLEAYARLGPTRPSGERRQ